jgi:hypothetical protein
MTWSRPALTAMSNVDQTVADRILAGDDKCDECGRLLAVGRMQAIPHVRYCADHSKEGRYVGVPLYAHKTAASVAMVKADPLAEDGLGESVRQLMNGYKRKR